MKIKKLMALVLSGVLAVSMLAGCDGKGGSSSEPTEPVDTSIAAVLNNEQAGNKVKVDFAYDSDLEEMMNKALVAYGSDASDGQVETQIKNSMDIDANKVAATLANLYGTGAAATKNTYYYIDVVKDNSGKTDEALMNSVADGIAFDQLKADNTAGGYKYTYSHDGKVAMVKSETANGVVNRYVAIVVTCTTTSAAE